jgi:hypothetical protein
MSENDAIMKFNTYAEYVRFLCRHDPRFKWLNHFFTTRAASDPTKTHVLVADSENSRFTTTRGLEALQHLKNRSPLVKTRLVLVRHDKTMNVDRNIIDAIAYTLDLDPWFLWRHFDQDDDLEEHRLEQGFDIPPALPSKRNSLGLGFSQYKYLSAVFLKDDLVPNATTGEIPRVLLLTKVLKENHI